MNSSLWLSLGLLCFAVLLSYLKVQYDSFIGSPDAQRCGLDGPPCPFGQQCANGFCIDSNPPNIPKSTGLPVLP